MGLGTEIAVPTGGAFKAGQFLLNKASKAMGKVKDGKTLEKLVDQKLTDSGQSRRDFMSLVGASGLMVALKTIGLGGLFKVGAKKDVAMKLRTHWHNSDVDYGTSGLAYFDFAGLTKSSREVLSKIMDKMHKSKELVRKIEGKLDQPNKRFVHENQVDEFGVEPHTAKKVIKMLRDEGYDVKMTGIIDDTGDVLHTAQKEGHKKFIDTYKKQSWKENVKDHQQYNDFVVYENDAGFMNWNKATKGKLDKPYVSTIDEVVEMVEPIVKKAEGGRIGLGTGGPPIESIKLGPLQLKPRASASFTTAQPYGPNLREKTWTDQIGIGGMLDLPGGFSLTGDYDKFRIKDRLYDADSKFIDERVRGDHDAWNIGLNWKKSFADGGLTKTIPPKRGPNPQGLPSALYNGIIRSRSY